jgi:hypothetical protein
VKREISDDGFIETFTNKYIHPFDPKPELICLEDIAHALSQQCRFSGHVKRFYSVAEHAWLASMYAPPHLAAEALMHDAAEAYLIDIPRPLKMYVQFFISDTMQFSYYVAEEKLLDVIGKKYELKLHPQSETVTKLDNQLLVREYLTLMNGNLPPGLVGVPALAMPRETITGWLPSVAKGRFLERAAELGIGR